MNTLTNPPKPPILSDLRRARRIKNGNKPCPHCGRTISANKEMCFAGATAATRE